MSKKDEKSLYQWEHEAEYYLRNIDTKGLLKHYMDRCDFYQKAWMQSLNRCTHLSKELDLIKPVEQRVVDLVKNNEYFDSYVFLYNDRNIFKRVWNIIRYICGVKYKETPRDNWILDKKDVNKLLDFMEKIDE